MPTSPRHSRLTVITINYNNADGLRKTIDSILSQSCQDYEWIVIDGGSSDGSRQLIEQHADKMAYWVSEPDKGIYNAMNKGLMHATGEYVQFLNSGDYYYDSNVIADFLSLGFTDDVVYGRAMVVDGDGNEIREWKLPDGALRLSFFWSHNLNHQASFFSRRCFDGFRFNECRRISSDIEMFMTLAYHGYSFRLFDRFIVNYDNTGISSSSSGQNNEFQDTVMTVLPPALRDDYRDIIQSRDVDILIMAKNIVDSNKFIRNLTRSILYPLNILAKSIKRQ